MIRGLPNVDGVEAVVDGAGVAMHRRNKIFRYA